MKKQTAVAVLVLLAVMGAPPATAQTTDLDALRTWNDLALESVRLARASDSDAARTYAMVNAGIYDAVNGIAVSRGDKPRDFALRRPQGAPSYGDQQAAAVSAAHAVLTGLYPDRAARFDEQLAADLAALGGGGRVAAGRTWGHTVGADVLAARANDGSSPVETQPAGSGPGVFAQAWSGVQYRNMTPFGIADAAPYIPQGPRGGLDYAAAFAEVRLLGDQAIPDADKSTRFVYWSLPAGTAQPPGEWIKIGLRVGESLALPAKARMFALLGMALADTSISTVRTKFAYRHWRPQAAIQQADTDDNPLTEKVDGWRARAGSAGSSPEYISGHSSFSGAGAAALAGFFCADRIAFTHTSDSAPIDPATGKPLQRSFPSFSAAAYDAGWSRVVGGLHFDFSNADGLAMGEQVAGEVLAKKLLLKSGPTHLGECPR